MNSEHTEPGGSSVCGTITTYTEPDGFHDPVDMSMGPHIFSVLNGIHDYGIVQRTVTRSASVYACNFAISTRE